MLRKYIVLTTIIGLLNIFLSSAVFAGTIEANSDKRKEVAEKVKAGIGKLGTGPSAKVEIKLYDKTKLKGYVNEMKDDRFVIVDSKTGAATEVAYSEVKQVRGNNLSQGVKLAIGIGIILALGILIASQTR